MSADRAPRSFDEIEIGDELTAKPDVSMERVRRFVGATGMMTARFTDHEGAQKQGLPGAIVPGIMSQGILAALIHRWAPGSDIQRIDTIFRAPVIVDSGPLARGVVTEKNAETRVLELDLVIENEDGETRVLGVASVKV